MCIYSCVTLSTTLLITRGPVQCRSPCDASMFISCLYIFLRLASKCLNCTRSPEEIVQKLHKYDWKHKINALKIDSDNFTKLPVTFLVENNNENRVKFAKFFNILLNFSLWYAWSRSPDIISNGFPFHLTTTRFHWLSKFWKPMFPSVFV